MQTSELYRFKNECCGCELCSNVCPKGLIKMHPDEEGFLYPLICDDGDCINCGRCLKICPLKSKHRKDVSLKDSYGGQFYNLEDTKKSSSGGYATAISRRFIEEGGVVIGVRYSTDFTGASYAVAETLEDIEQFRTSKYIQASKNNIYELVKKNTNKKILFIGLPCEVSALYNYLGANIDNIYTISLICHGPTSPRVQSEFVRILEDKFSSTLQSFSVRHKHNGWKPYYIKAEFVNGYKYTELFKGSCYDVAFQYLKRPSCSICKYKLGNNEFGLVADLTLGDFHAVENHMPQYNIWGVSQASVQTDKGYYLIELAKSLCKVDKIPSAIIKKYNYAYHSPIKQKRGRELYKTRLLKYGLKKSASSLIIRIPQFYIDVKRTILSFLYKLKMLCTYKYE